MQKNTKTLFLIFSLVLFLLGMVTFWYSHSYSTIRPADRDFSLDREALVTRVVMHDQQKDEKVALIKDERGQWMLSSMQPANDLAVRELISVMERMSVRQPVSISNREKVEQMLAQKGVKVDVYVQAYRIHIGNLKMWPYQRRYQVFWVGEDTPDGESTYMRKAGSDMAFKVHHPGRESGVSYLFEPGIRAWLDPVIIDLDWKEIERVSVEVYDEPGESFHLKLEGEGGFGFYAWDQPDQPLTFDVDTAKVMRYISSFKDIHYERLLDKQARERKKEFIFEQPFMKITVQSVYSHETGFTAYARRVTDEQKQVTGAIDRDPNRFYIKMGEGEFALAQYYVFNRILRRLSFFEK